MLSQLSKQPNVYVVNLCLRAEGSSGYPPRTPVLADEFTHVKNEVDLRFLTKKYRLYYASFMIACFNRISCMESVDFNVQWYNSGDTEFFRSLSQETRKILAEVQHATDYTVTERICMEWNAIKKSCRSFSQLMSPEDFSKITNFDKLLNIYPNHKKMNVIHRCLF